MQSECKESAEHHLGTLSNDKGQSVTETSCKVLRCTYGSVNWRNNLWSSNRTKISCHAYDKRNSLLLPHAIMNIARIVHRLYIASVCARVRGHAPTNPPRFP